MCYNECIIFKEGKAMSEVKEVKKKTVKKPTVHTAKKTLFTAKGRVNKGESFTCSANEEKAFKKAKAI